MIEQLEEVLAIVKKAPFTNNNPRDVMKAMFFLEVAIEAVKELEIE